MREKARQTRLVRLGQQWEQVLSAWQVKRLEEREAPYEDWLNQLATNPAYSLIDVRREYSKMQTWCGVNRKMPTRRRFVAWLNRIEKPMDAAKGSRTHESIIDRS